MVTTIHWHCCHHQYCLLLSYKQKFLIKFVLRSKSILCRIEVLIGKQFRWMKNKIHCFNKFLLILPLPLFEKPSIPTTTKKFFVSIIWIPKIRSWKAIGHVGKNQFALNYHLILCELKYFQPSQQFNFNRPACVFVLTCIEKSTI